MSEPLTDADLDQAIIDAARERIAAIRARPRDEQRIADANAAYSELVALKNASA